MKDRAIKNLRAAVNITKVQLLQLLAGSFLFSLGVNLFIVPCGTYNGGVLGISQLLYTFACRSNPAFADFNFTSIAYYLLNVPLFVLAFFQLGPNFLVRSVICVTVESIFLGVLPIPQEMLVDSMLTSVMCGGVVAGAGSGLIFLSRSSAGGVDIIGMYLTKKYRMLSIGKLSLGVNLVIYGICALTLNVSVAIYSLIYSVVMSLVLDKVHAQNICTEMVIFTKKDPKPIVQYITSEVKRSANFWTGVSGYTGDDSHVIYTVISKYEAHRLEVFLKQYDPHIFAIMNHGVAIEGNFEKKL